MHLVEEDGIDDVDAERRAYRTRRQAETTCREARARHYFARFSFVTVTYKALVLSDRLASFYPDLADHEFAAPLAFIAMSVPLLRDRAMLGAALAALVAVLLTSELPLKLGIIAAAATGIAAGLLLERRKA